MVASVPSPTTPLGVGALGEVHSRMHGRVLKVFENPLAYGATGSSDDTTPFQDAIDAAYDAGGGVVTVPPGTWRANVVIKPRVVLRGAGVGVTVLKAVAGSNADVVKGLNFASCTNKLKEVLDYNRGAYEIGIEDLTVDGDKATQSAGFGVRFWGRAPRFNNVEIRNCKESGLWTEFTEVDSFLDQNQVLEGYFENVLIHHNDNHGWVMRGPHDSVVSSVTIYDNTNWAIRIEANADPITGYNGGLTAYTLNTFLNGNGWYVGGSFLMAVGGQAAQGATGTCFEMTSQQGSCKLVGTFISGGVTGGILRGSNNSFDVTVSDNTTGLQLDGVSLSNILVTTFNNDTTFLISTENGGNIIRGVVALSVGDVLFSGTPHITDIVDITQIGTAGSTSYSRLPQLLPADRPTSPFRGLTYYDREINDLILYDGASWVTANPSPYQTVLPGGDGGLGQLENLVLRSEEFDNASWLKSAGGGGVTPPTITANTATAPNGTVTADTYTQKEISGENTLRQPITVSGAVGARTFTFSVYVKGTALSDEKLLNVFIDDGASENQAGTIATQVELDQTRWKRVSTSYTFATGNVGTTVQPLIAGGSLDINDTCYVWGAQLSETTAQLSYVPTTSAAVASSQGLALNRGLATVRRIARQKFTLTDAATVAVDASLGDYFVLSTAANRTIGAPSSGIEGQEINFDILNSSGGAITTTWNGAFKLAGSWTDPATTKRRTIKFYYDGTNWVETSRAGADI